MGIFNLLSLGELTLKLNLYNLLSKAAPQPLCKWEVALLSAQSLTVASRLLYSSEHSSCPQCRWSHQEGFESLTDLVKKRLTLDMTE